MKDAIDKRNERDRIAKSIVKRSNVVYLSREEAEYQEKEKKEKEKADEILMRLEQEAKEDEEKKSKEIQEMMFLMAKQELGDKTKKYGVSLDDIAQERVEAILGDKERLLQKLIQDTEISRIIPSISNLEEELGTKQDRDNTQTEEADIPKNEAVQEEAAPLVSEEIK